MNIRPIASSSAGNAIVVDDGHSRLLLDCGVSVGRLRRELGTLTSVDAVLLSHEHADHARALPHMLAAGCPVYASVGTLEARGVATHHRTHAMRPWHIASVSVGTWRISAFPLIHDATQPLGFLSRSVRTDECVLYIVDTGYVPERFVGVTHALIEANYCGRLVLDSLESGSLDVRQHSRLINNHLSIDQAIEVLGRLNPRLLVEAWLMHLSDRHSDAVSFKEMAERAIGKPVHVAPR